MVRAWAAHHDPMREGATGRGRRRGAARAGQWSSAKTILRWVCRCGLVNKDTPRQGAFFVLTFLRKLPPAESWNSHQSRLGIWASDPQLGLVVKMPEWFNEIRRKPAPKPRPNWKAPVSTHPRSKTLRNSRFGRMQVWLVPPR